MLKFTFYKKLEGGKYVNRTAHLEIKYAKQSYSCSYNKSLDLVSNTSYVKFFFAILVPLGRNTGLSTLKGSISDFSHSFWNFRKTPKNFPSVTAAPGHTFLETWGSPFFFTFHHIYFSWLLCFGDSQIVSEHMVMKKGAASLQIIFNSWLNFQAQESIQVILISLQKITWPNYWLLKYPKQFHYHITLTWLTRVNFFDSNYCAC